MSKKKLTDRDVVKMQGQVVLLHGVFKPGFYDRLTKQGPEHVFVMEGRPSLDGSKVSSRELLKRKIVPTVISDNMAGFLFYKKMVKEVWLSSQITDRAGSICDVGSLMLCILAKTHCVPVRTYSSSRRTKALGTQKDLMTFLGKRLAPAGVKGFVPLQEWISRHYVTEMILEE